MIDTLHRMGLVNNFTRLLIFIITCITVTLVFYSSGVRAGSGDNYPTVWKTGALGQYVDNWGYSTRYCTSWVAWALHDRNGFTMPRAIGNASNWGSWAASRGYAVNESPSVGSVAWWPGGNHVAWVKAVNGNNTVTIEEYNSRYTDGRYNVRNIAKNSARYIHFKDIQGGSIENIYAINRQDVGSRSTALHILNGSEPNNRLLSTGTTLHQTTLDWSFAIGERNGDNKPDLYAINRKDAGSNSTAFHVIDGANPGRFLANTGTALHQTDQNWSFAVADYNRDGVLDLYAINRKDAGSNSTALHVIDGANPGRFLANIGTALHQTDQNWSFAVADFNRDGKPDVYAFNKQDRGSGKTAIHIIDGNSPGRFLLSSATALHHTDHNWDFSVKDYNRDSIPDLYAFNKQDIGSNSTAIHVLNGANLSQFLLSRGTWLHKTDGNWSFY